MGYSSEELRKLINEAESELREPGTVLFSQGRYEVTRILGEGGMGITCLAKEYSAGNLKRPVVLKFVKDSLDSRGLAQFLNEVQLSILFNHPNLVPVFRLESEVVSVKAKRKSRVGRHLQDHVVYYAVMQYIDGWNLRQIVNRLKRLKILLNFEMTMFLAGRVARGLHFVHEYRDENGEHLELVHRDVSPENILLDRFARIKVADFGITQARKHRGDSSFRWAGNLRYCSPEQLDGRDLDRRSDIYNIGLLLYFLFTNTDRFGKEADLDNSRDRIRSKMAKSPLADLQHVDETFARICEVCLREDRDERFQSCEELANNIDIYLSDRNKHVTNEQLEEVLNDLFSPEPSFVSRRFIPLTGSAILEQPDYDPGLVSQDAEPARQMETVRWDPPKDQPPPTP